MLGKIACQDEDEHRFGQLRGLHVPGTEHQPALGAVDDATKQEDDDQADEKCTVQHIGMPAERLVINTQYGNHPDQPDHGPHQLFQMHTTGAFKSLRRGTV